MPTRPPRACPRCGAPIGATCARCGPPIYQPNATTRGYTRAWARYARDFRARFPFCGVRLDGRFHGEHSACARDGRRTIARLVDHIVPIIDGGSMWDETNLQSLCYPCHFAKTDAERRRRASGRA